MIKINAKYIKAIYPFVASNDVRYYLNGIAIDKHQDSGAVIRATNGHVAAIIYDKEAVCDESILLKLNKNALPHCVVRGKAERFLIVEGKRATIRDSADDEYYIQPNSCLIDYDKYPCFKGLVPKNLVMGAPGQYNPAYIDFFCKQKLPSLRYQGLVFFHDPSQPDTGVLVIRNTAMPEFFGLLMPMRGDPLTVAVPTWWRSEKEIEAVTANS